MSTHTVTGDELFRHARIDRAEFERIAREVFGLEREIELVRKRDSLGLGWHMAWSWAHRINVSPYNRTVKQAAITLAHELWHAVQAETTENLTEVALREEQLLPYDQRPSEVEARQAEALFWRELLPCFRITERGRQELAERRAAQEVRR